MSKWIIRELHEVEKIEIKTQNIDNLRVYICPKCHGSSKHPINAEPYYKYCSYCGANMQDTN